MRRTDDGSLRRAWTPRHTRALGCALLVLAAHAALWFAAAPSAPPAARAVAAVQLRNVPAYRRANDVADAPVPVVVATESPPRATAPPRLLTPAPRPPRAADTFSPAPAPPAPSEIASDDTAIAPAADGGATTALPVYPTRVPPSARLDYVLQRGGTTGSARLDWQVDGERYRLEFQASITPGRALERRSLGGFDAAGLAPLRLADRRNGRDVRAANFQRERGKVSFSGPGWELPLQHGAQDRLSWLVQLVAIAAAAPDALHEGAAVSMWVVGVRGAVSLWRFDVRGREAGLGDAPAWWLVREPAHPYDQRVEVWLDAARGHWPVRVRQTQVPGGEPLEWTLRDGPQQATGS